MRPEIITEITPINGAVGGHLDLDAKLGGAGNLARHNFMQTRVALAPKATAQLGDRKREFPPDIVHDLHTMPLRSIVNDSWAYSLKGNSEHDWGMDIWPKRENYKTRLKAHLKLKGETQAQFAALLGLSLTHFRNGLYREEKRLGVDALSQSAGIFGCSVSEFVDDPGAEIAGQTTEGLSEKSRFLASLMFDKFKASDLTDEDREILYQDYLQNYDRLKSLKARHERKN